MDPARVLAAQYWEIALGAHLWQGRVLQVADCTFINNVAAYGGALFGANGEITSISTSTFDGNVAQDTRNIEEQQAMQEGPGPAFYVPGGPPGAGGAVYLDVRHVEEAFYESSISTSQRTKFAHTWPDGSEVTVSGLTFTANQGVTCGAALCARGHKGITIENSEFYRNFMSESAAGGAGAVGFALGDAILRTLSMQENTGIDGGALSVGSGPVHSFKDATFS